MPVMPRPNKKASDIVFKLIGKPANLAFKRDKRQKEIDRRLLFEESSRVR